MRLGLMPTFKSCGIYFDISYCTTHLVANKTIVVKPWNGRAFWCYNLNMNTNRNTILLFGSAAVLLIVAVIMAVSLTLRRDGGNEKNINTYTAYDSSVPRQASPSSETIGPVTVHESVAGSRLVENSEAKVSLKVPESWDISAEEDAFYYIAAAFVTDTAWANVYVEPFPNPENLDVKKWSIRNLEVSDFIDVKVGATDGVRYTTKAIYEGQVSENSYIVGLALPQGDEIVSVSCSTGGTEYNTLITTCEDIVSTFTLKK